MNKSEGFMKKMMMKKLGTMFAMGLLPQGTTHTMNIDKLPTLNVSNEIGLAGIPANVVESAHTENGIITRCTYYGYAEGTRNKLLQKCISETARPTIYFTAALGVLMTFDQIATIILNDYPPLALGGSHALSLIAKILTGYLYSTYLSEHTDAFHTFRIFKDYESKRIPVAQLPADLQFTNAINKESAGNNLDWFLRRQYNDPAKNNQMMNALIIDNHECGNASCDDMNCHADVHNQKLTLPCSHSYHIACLKYQKALRHPANAKPTWCPQCPAD